MEVLSEKLILGARILARRSNFGMIPVHVSLHDQRRIIFKHGSGNKIKIS